MSFLVTVTAASHPPPALSCSTRCANYVTASNTVHYCVLPSSRLLPATFHTDVDFALCTPEQLLLFHLTHLHTKCVSHCPYAANSTWINIAFT